MKRLLSSELKELTNPENQISRHVSAELIEIAVKTNFEVATTAPKVSVLLGTIGEDTLLKLIVVIIKQFCDSLNVPAMTAMQIFECAKEYITTYPLNSVKDLILCLRKAKKGEYGQIYNRLDQATIFTFITKYEEERSQYFENKRKNLKAQQESDQLGLINAIPEEFRTATKKQAKALKHTPRLDEFRKSQADGLTPMNSHEKYLQELELSFAVMTKEQLDSLYKEAKQKSNVQIIRMIEDFKISIQESQTFE